MKKELKLDLTVGIKRLGLITRSLVNSKIVGDYRSVFKGSGLEFHDYRHYTPEDDASMIDWKASIRSQELLVKEFIEERNLSVFFLIDVSSSMLYSTLDKLKIEYSAELIATLSYTILQAGDSVGFALFNDKVIRQQPPKAGARQYYNVVRTLADTSHYGGAYDLCEALKFTMAFLKEFSVVIIISDFIGLKNDWKHYLKLVGKKFDLIGIMIRDPRDKFLPDYDGQAILGDMYSDKQLVVNINSISGDYTRYVEAREREIKSAFIDSKSDFIELTTDKPFLKPVTDLLLRRAKRTR